MALTTIQKVRLEIGDTDVSMPILTDDEYQYFLDKYDQSVNKAAVDAAKSILFKLSSRTRERVDALEIYGNQWAENYRQALLSYLSNPNLSTAIQGAQPYAGGISKADIADNLSNTDNQVVNLTRSLASESDTAFDPYNSSNPFNIDYTE